MAWIKANLLMDGNHFETVGFPCSDDEIMRLTRRRGDTKLQSLSIILLIQKG